MQVQFTVNGKRTSLDVAPNTLLVQALREHLHLTGTHVGCDTAQCGACTVMVNGRSIKSCNVLAAQVQGADITTIEGLAEADGTMHPMQAAFKDCHGLQCGFCTTGMVMSAVDLVQNYPGASEQQIRELLEGNMCRCTGYQNIVKAVQQGQAAMQAA
ncbi:MAG: (2Fe-2S)-binding protein [Rhodoferax sp.]|nr:(2Fe-2S)-binding protein [Rhodoferax sp.]